MVWRLPACTLTFSNLKAIVRTSDPFSALVPQAHSSGPPQALWVFNAVP